MGMRLHGRGVRQIWTTVVKIFGWLSSAFVAAVLMARIAQAHSNVSITEEVLPTTHYADLFRNLKDTFSADEEGCSETEGSTGFFQWTIAGYCSNINRLMVHWLGSIMRGHNDIAVVTAYTRIEAFHYVKCLEESGGIVTDGRWSCIFKDMPHLCPFSEEKDWMHLMMSRGVSYKERQAAKVHQSYQYTPEIVDEIEEALDGSGVDIISAMAALLGYLHSHRQPWLKKDIERVLEEPEIASVRDGAYVGIHVRRGDKLLHEARRHETEEYLSRAAYVLGNRLTETRMSIDDIKGIWVSSDDSSVILDVKRLASGFFPNVDKANIVWISSRAVSGKPHHKDAVPTATYELLYDSFVIWFAELEMLANADVFVGTFSSNVSRMLMLMREANRLSRDTTISIDRPEWSPGRRLDRKAIATE